MELVFVILLEQDGADEADDAVLVREDADHIGAALHFLVQAFQRIGAVELDPVLLGEGHVGEHVVLGIVHASAELWPAGAQLISDLPPDLRRSGMVGLKEDLTDCSGNDGILALGHIGQGVAHEVDAAALPGRAHDAGNRRLEPLVGIGDDQLHAGQAAPDEVLEEARPERLGFGRTDVQADDLALALGVDGHSDYRGDTDDPPALAHLEIGSIEPEVGPVAGERPLEEGVDPLVDVLAQLGYRGLGDASHAHRLHQFIDAPGADAGDPCFLDHRDQRLLDGLPWLQKAGKVGAGPQFGDLEIERAEPGVETAVAVAIAPGRAIAGTLVPAGADQAIDVGLHDDL